MIKRLNWIKTETYYVKGNACYLLDHVFDGEIHEWWIYDKEYGAKMLMWGTKKLIIPSDEQIDSYIKIYEQEYKD